MQLRRLRNEPIDVGAYELAYAELSGIREAHETCTESALDCRAGILWATNTAFMHLDADLDGALDAGTTRSLLLHHAAEVNDMLARRTSGRVGGLFVAGTRLQAAIAVRSY
ncbi:MAG: hypothetical protein QOC60_1380 [Frankiaceae bacterium]|jgi:hypothetical protein|nr:hypothetical protein [Frankiaceae bacterium]MDQ1715435.1 hypothetical protein [Frankiaceae bacterium]